MAQIPYLNGRGCNRRITGYSTVSDCQEEAVLTAGEWVSHLAPNGKLYIRLSQKGRSGLTVVFQHRFCWELENGPIPVGYTIDHLDIDGTTNNDLKNLRLATSSQQGQNTKVSRDSASTYKGVSWHKTNKKWRVLVYENSLQVVQSYWDDVILAARFYDVIVLQLWGDRAQTNFPRLDYPEEL